MAQGKLKSSDFDVLEAEIAMTLAERSLPMDKRIELQRRFEAIRLKAGIPQPSEG